MVGACQQNSGIFLVRGGGLDGRSAGAEAGTGTRCRRENHRAGSGLGDQITWAGSGLGAARDRTRYRRGPRLELGQDTGGGRGRDWDKMPTGAEAGTGTRCRRGPRLSRQGANQLKRKRSIISSNNPGFSKSFSLVMIKLLCSKNPASW